MKVPKGWRIQELGDICNVVRGRFSHRPRNDPRFYGGHTPFVQTGDIAAAGREILRYSQTLNELGCSVSKIFPKGTLLMTIAANIGDIAILGFEAACPDSLVALVPNPDLSRDFLYQHLNARKCELEALAPQNAQKNLSIEKLSPLPILIPPLPEQRRIAEILGSWDRAIETQQKLITAKSNRLRSLRHLLLTGSRRFPEFQGKWRKFYLGDLLLEEERYADWNDADTYNLVSVRRRSGGVFFRESLKGSQIKTKVMKTIHAGDFLIARMQAVHGAIAVVPEAHDGKHVSDSYNTLKPRDSEALDIHFFGWLSTLPQFYRLIRISSHGVVIEKMTFDLADFLKRSVTLPPTKSEQTRIATFLNAAQQEITLLTNQLGALKQQKRGLMQKLLTGEVRV